MSWVQEKPLRLSGGFYWLNNLFLVTDAYKEIPKNKASSAFKFVTAGCYIFANAMLAISSKGHGDNQKEGHEAMTRLADVTAQVVAAQPKEVQDALVNRVSGYLAAQPEAHMKAEDISKMLHTKLERIMCKKGHETAPEPHPPEKSWQQRVQTTATEPPTLSI